MSGWYVMSNQFTRRDYAVTEKFNNVGAAVAWMLRYLPHKPFFSVQFHRTPPRG